MFCPNCGETISNKSFFCRYCGVNIKDMLVATEEAEEIRQTSVEAVRPVVEQELEPVAVTEEIEQPCVIAEKEIDFQTDNKTCAVCGFGIGDGVRFCKNCGGKIAESVKPPLQSYTPEPVAVPVQRIIPATRRFCKNCGAKLPSKGRFCKSCGCQIPGGHYEK